jgi:hypothetical protein
MKLCDSPLYEKQRIISWASLCIVSFMVLMVDLISFPTQKPIVNYDGFYE